MPPPTHHMPPELIERLDKTPPRVSAALLRRIGGFLLPYWRRFLAAAAVILLSAGLGVIPSLLTGRIIDEGLLAGDFDRLCRLILWSVGLAVLSNAVGLLETMLNSSVAHGITRDIKNRLFRHLQSMSYRFFTDTRQGDVITRMTEDVSGVRTVISQTMASTLKHVVTIIITLIAMFRTHWGLALCGVAVLPLFMLPTKLTGDRRWKIARRMQREQDESNQILNETLSISGQLLSKLFGREDTEFERFCSVNQNVYRLSVAETLTGRLFFATINIFVTVSPLILYFAGGWLMLRSGSTLTLGEITAMVTLLGRVHRPLDELLNIHVDLTRSLALFERIFEYFDLQPEVRDRAGCREVGRLRGEVTYAHVGFSYREDAPVLEDISFTVRPGESFAVVGGSGAGKSTLIALLPRLYDVTAGSIRIDGIDIRDMSQASLRRNIGMVSQDTYLFNASIRDNLLYAKPEATEEELIEACRRASIHDFIAGLPEGYDTLVGNRGLRLSGGEKQRLSIARVLLKDPPIILLDEATSSLDSVSESHIQAAIRPLLCDRTSLVVAHRLSTIIASDRIAVLQDHRITESGTHAELLRQSAAYRTFFETQFALPEDKEGNHA